MTDKEKTTSKEPFLKRSEFLGLGLAGALILITGQSLVALLSYLKPQTSGGFGGLVYAGKVDEFPVGSVNYIQAGRCYVVHLEEGLIAYWQRCTHLGCAVPWAQAEGQFHCPCHGSLFDKRGVVTGGPAPKPLNTFPIVIKNGEVWVDTSKPTERSGFDPSQVTGV